MLSSRTYIAVPPGATIKDQLEYRGMSQKEFAARMNMSQKHISKLINGEVQLTPETAVLLETVLSVPAEYWNKLEAGYREKLIKVRLENEMEEDIQIAKNLPYSEMVKLGWIEGTRDPKEKVIRLRRYFELVNLMLLGDGKITNIACRRLAITEKSDLALIAWAQEAKLKARDIKTSRLDIKKVRNAIPSIRKLTVLDSEDFIPKLNAILADCGIALVYLPHLKGSFLQGATFLDGNRAVIGMTSRGKDADIFWFSLFHEIAHIVLGHIGNEDGTTDEEEKTADTWATNTLISEEDFNRFRCNNDYSKKSVASYAESLGIAPGILVGRMQHEGLIEYSMLNDLKAKYEITASV